jgi:hypothetical protein
VRGLPFRFEDYEGRPLSCARGPIHRACADADEEIVEIPERRHFAALAHWRETGDTAFAPAACHEAAAEDAHRECRRWIAALPEPGAAACALTWHDAVEASLACAKTARPAAAERLTRVADSRFVSVTRHTAVTVGARRYVPAPAAVTPDSWRDCDAVTDTQQLRRGVPR